jgi:hypothetical protein
MHNFLINVTPPPGWVPQENVMDDDDAPGELQTLCGSCAKVLCDRPSTGVVLLFRAVRQDVVARTEREHDDDDEQATPLPPAPTRKRRRRQKKKARTIATHDERVLRGALCAEITSPWLVCVLRVRAPPDADADAPSTTLEVVEIVSARPRSAVLTSAALKRCAVESDYAVRGAAGRGRATAIADVMRPLSLVHGIAPAQPITQQQHFDCLMVDPMPYVCRNALQPPEYFQRVSALSADGVRLLSARECDLLLDCGAAAADDDDTAMDDGDADAARRAAFSKLCWGAPVSEELFARLAPRLLAEARHEWGAATRYHELLRAQRTFGDECVRVADPTELAYMRRDLVRTWTDARTGDVFLLARDTADAYDAVARALATIGQLTLLTAEVDDDHDDASTDGAYLDRVRTVAGDARGSTLVVAAVAHRERYLRTHTALDVVHYDSAVAGMSDAVLGRVLLLVVDRCHALGTAQLARLLERFAAHGTRHVVLGGSAVCTPDTAGQPFAALADQQTATSITLADITWHTQAWQTLADKLSAQLYRDVPSMLAARRGAGPAYVFVHTAGDRRRVLDEHGAQLGHDAVVRCVHDRGFYELPLRPTVCVVLPGADAEPAMDRGQLAMLAGCRAPLPDALCAVGSAEDVARTCRTRARRRRTLLAQWLASSHHQQQQQQQQQ